MIYFRTELKLLSIGIYSTGLDATFPQGILKQLSVSYIWRGSRRLHNELIIK
jgi:hypothetical protein